MGSANELSRGKAAFIDSVKQKIRKKEKKWMKKATWEVAEVNKMEFERSRTMEEKRTGGGKEKYLF